MQGSSPAGRDRRPERPSRPRSDSNRSDSRRAGGAPGRGARDAGRNRDARSDNDRPYRDRSQGERSERGRGQGERPFRDRSGSERSERGRGQGERPFRDRGQGERSYRDRGQGDRSGYPRRSGEPKRPRFSDRPREHVGAYANAPAIPEGLDIGALDRDVRAELRSLSKPTAEAVSGHLVMTAMLLDSKPTLALEHARAARRRAARVGAVREAVGIAAYHAREWAEALTELRTARRISGDPRNLALIADCERALGRPAQAIRALSDPEVGRLDADERVELLIVVAGARRDLDQTEAALAVLARGGLDRSRPRPGAARLWYAYADALAALGRREEAAQWFVASAEQDVDDELDAAERAADLV